MSDNQQSSSDLERDVEQRRSEVHGTINELKERFSPEAAADYGLNYIRGPGGQRLLGAIRDNPLAAALVLGGLGWLFYTANQPEEERRRHLARSGRRVRVYEGRDEPYLNENDLMPDDGTDPTSTVPDRSTSSVTAPLTTKPVLGDPLSGSDAARIVTPSNGMPTGAGTTGVPKATPSTSTETDRDPSRSL